MWAESIWPRTKAGKTQWIFPVFCCFQADGKCDIYKTVNIGYNKMSN